MTGKIDPSTPEFRRWIRATILLGYQRWRDAPPEDAENMIFSICADLMIHEVLGKSCNDADARKILDDLIDQLKQIFEKHVERADQ